MHPQIPLPVSLADGETFSSFITGDNAQLVAHLQQCINAPSSDQTPLTFISGESGVGKSHLLFAVCHDASDANKQAQYVDLSESGSFEPSMLQGMEHVSVVCLDNIHAISEKQDWQEATFDLINRVIEAKTAQLIITADKAPAQLGFSLKDLNSRLVWGVSYQCHSLNDEQKIEALITRGKQRGFSLSPEVGRFLLTHVQRDMPALMQTLSTLDTLSLQEKRRLTIPFVKQVFDI